MADHLVKLALQFRQWLGGAPLNDEALRAIGNLTAPDFARLGHGLTAITGNPPKKIADELIGRARALYAKRPRRAIHVARIAIAFAGLAKDVSVPGDDADALLETEGDAWMEYAAALLEVGETPDADLAGQEAEFSYRLAATESADYKLQLLAYLQGQVLASAGDVERGLAIIEQAANNLLVRHKRRDKYVTGRTIYAALLLSDGRVEEALKVFEKIGDLARRSNDMESLAYILSNVGTCNARLKRFDDARACLNTALEMFTHLDMPAELPRLRSALAVTLIEEGRYNEAISELFKNRAAFLALEEPVVAMEVNLQIVEVLFLAGRLADVPSLCEEMVQVFSKARLPAQVKKALAYLQAVTMRRPYTERDFQHVRSFLELVAEDEGEVFEPLTD